MTTAPTVWLLVVLSYQTPLDLGHVGILGVYREAASCETDQRATAATSKAPLGFELQSPGKPFVAYCAETGIWTVVKQ